MYSTLYYIVVALFAAMLLLNLYFRLKVYSVYKVLVKNEVEFEAAHLFDKSKMENEIYPKYPSMTKEIKTFYRHFHYSLKMASVLVTLITILGGVLMYYRFAT